MRRSTVFAFAMLTLATGALADPTPKTAAKTKRICVQGNNGNPLFPQMKCHTVKLDTEDAPVAAPQVAAAPVTSGNSAVTPVSMTTPH